MKWVKDLLLLAILAAPVRGGVEFDGTDDYLDAGDVADIDTLTAISVSVWVYNDVITSDDIYVSKSTSTGNGDGWFLRRNDATTRADSYNVLITESTGTGFISLIGAANSTLATTWQHVCFTFTENVANGLHLYVDGVEDANSPASTVGIIGIDSGATTLKMGQCNSTSFFDGRISDVQIYNRALTATEVSLIAASRLKGPKFSGLLHYWPLDDVAEGASADGATFKDRAGTADGTGNDGANNTGLVGRAENYLSYP